MQGISDYAWGHYIQKRKRELKREHRVFFSPKTRNRIANG